MKFPLYHRFIIIISIAIIINIVLSIWISPLPITGSIPRESYTEDDSLPSNKCVFRTYPPNRYYYPDGLINYNELPDFLTQRPISVGRSLLFSMNQHENSALIHHGKIKDLMEDCLTPTALIHHYCPYQMYIIQLHYNQLVICLEKR